MTKINWEERIKVYDDAIMANGREYQLHVALEELAECQKEICKALRGNIRPAGIAEEVADALIVLEQVVHIYKIQDCVDAFMDSKIKRLQDNLRKVWKSG